MHDVLDSLGKNSSSKEIVPQSSARPGAGWDDVSHWSSKTHGTTFGPKQRVTATVALNPHSLAYVKWY